MRRAPPSSARRSQAAGAVVAESAAPLAVPLRRCRLRRLLCVAASNITASYAHWMMPRCPACARIRGRYVLRPSGKSRHTSQGQRPSPAVRGSKTGLVIRRPFAFCRMVVPVYVLLWSLRGLCGGRFPANAPHPPGGHVKQMHARTRPHCHPLPWVNLHPRAPSNGLRPASPAGSRRDGQGEAMLIRSATPFYIACFSDVAARF